MSSIQPIARRYHDAWTSGDGETLASLLSPNFRLEAGDNTIEGPDAFLDSGAFPREATVTMIAGA